MLFTVSGTDCVDRGDCAMSSTAFVRLLGASPTLSGRLSTTVRPEDFFCLMIASDALAATA